ncbi:class I SAM-dependent methyltransferase [Saccharopolyspora cebuensis]|uniref:Class I SAM-dependent methyltransferase n=1 Tax=Saccharopolyspora cebuensis TaxID=418759 RepID=A0ABV4CMJ5_9PSEU
MAGNGTQGLCFGEIADRYDHFRPGVPAEALDWLLPDSCETVIDLAAGTGALTRSLVGCVRHVVAVEPDPRMRETLARTCPEALLLSGTAERMPLPDDRADALLISMAWHWMDPQHAVPEIARVLRAGGTFGVLWNHRDLSVPWVAELDRFTRAARVRESGPDGPAQAPSRSVMDPPTGSLFSPLAELRLTWSMPVTAEEIVGLMGTDASAIALPPEARHAVDEQVAGYVHDELGLSRDRTIELPMACRCLRTTRNPDAAP